MGVNGIYGLSGSGLDIESMVKVGMMGKQNEYDKMAQKYTKNEWMKAAYIELNSSITSFNMTKLSDYKMTSTMNAKSVVSSSAAVKATANASTDLRSHSVEVDNLVSGASLVGTNKMQRYAITSDTTNESSMNLADVLFANLERDNGTVSGNIAAVKMTATGRTTGTSTDGTDIATAHSFGKTNNYADFSNLSTATWSSENPNQLVFGDFIGTVGSWNPATGNNTWQKETDENGELTGKWQKWDSGTNAYVTTDEEPDFTTATWTNGQLVTTDGSVFDASDITWTTTDSAKWQQDEDGNFFTEVSAESLNADQEAFSFTISDGAGHEDTISYTYNELLGLNGEKAKTFYDLVNDINKISGINIKASYDSEYDRFSFYNTKSGTGNDIQITFGSDDGNKAESRASLVARNFFNNMGLYQSVNGVLKGNDGNTATENDNNTLLFNLENSATETTGVRTFEGKDATIRIDGLSYNSADNKILKDGITYEAVGETNGTVARISVSQDVDAIVDKVKSFVEDYNKILSSLYEKYDEKPDSNYKPLTQSQKDAMKDEQVEKWEEKAKKGILYHDQTLSKIIQNMRNAVSNQIELEDGTTTSAFSIGISTVAGNIKGQLTLDEDKLRAALANNPDSVKNVFTSLDAKDMSNSSKMGIAQRLGDVFTSATKTIKSRAGSSTDVVEDSDLNNLLRQLQTKMSNFKKMMDAFEDKLYKKYDTMESTLAKLGTQLNFISGVGQ